MADLTHVSTADLVRELEGRDGIGCHIVNNVLSIDRSCLGERYFQNVEYTGPLTMLVVRGERD